MGAPLLFFMLYLLLFQHLPDYKQDILAVSHMHLQALSLKLLPRKVMLSFSYRSSINFRPLIYNFFFVSTTILSYICFIIFSLTRHLPFILTKERRLRLICLYFKSRNRTSTAVSESLSFNVSTGVSEK